MLALGWLPRYQRMELLYLLRLGVQRHAGEGLSLCVNPCKRKLKVAKSCHQRVACSNERWVVDVVKESPTNEIQKRKEEVLVKIEGGRKKNVGKLDAVEEKVFVGE